MYLLSSMIELKVIFFVTLVCCVVGLDNKEKLDSHLQSGRLQGKEQVREKHRMKGSVQSIEDVCVRVNISIQRWASRREGGCVRACGL